MCCLHGTYILVGKAHNCTNIKKLYTKKNVRMENMVYGIYSKYNEAICDLTHEFSNIDLLVESLTNFFKY